MQRARPASSSAPRPLVGTVLATLGLPGLLGVVLALAVASPASAHAGLGASDPAEGATVSTDLERVTLTFTEPPLAGLDAGLRIEVRDADGTDESTGDVAVRGSAMSKAVDLSVGPHTVLWRYVSPDGHPIDGQVAFTVEAAAPPSSPPSSAVPTPTGPSSAVPGSAGPGSSAAEPTTSDPSGPRGAAAPWVLGGIVVVLLGAAAVAVSVRRRRRG